MCVVLSKIKTDMRTVDIPKIIQYSGIDAKVLAKELFPLHKFPSEALSRIVSGKSVLDANQLSRLSELTGQSVDTLFNRVPWVASSKKDKIVFTAGDYTAELDTSKWTSKVYHNNSIFHETVLHSRSIPLSEYLKAISEIIEKHKNN